MATYTINITLTNQQLQIISAAGEQVTFAKKNPATGGPLYNVAWITMPPMQSMTVTWQDSYSVYASNTTIQDGAVISVVSYESTNMGDQWNWIGTSFGTATPSGNPYITIFDSAPDSGNPWSLGLAQASSESTSPKPVNYSMILNSQTDTLTPVETVFVFLSSYTNGGSVISHVAGGLGVASPACEVQLTPADPTANLTLNSSDVFVLS